MRRGERETGRRGDGETGRRGDGETGREIANSKLSPCLPVSLSPRLLQPFGIFIEYIIAANASRCLSNLSPSVEIIIFNCWFWP